ncbi:hypothetical protein NSQ54_01340 [Alkalihalobacillus sp. FSL W8-0930]
MIREDMYPLVNRYIVCATARNVIERHLRKMPTERLRMMSYELGKELHELKKEMHKQQVKLAKVPPSSSDFYGYTLYHKGWRSEHQVLKAIIQQEVEELLDELKLKTVSKR